jgi:hypothetical protein
MRGIVATVATLVMVGAGAGCHHGKQPAPVTCAQAATSIANGMKIVRPDLEAAGVELEPGLVSVCVDDNWSVAIIRCYAGGSNPPELRACSEQLSDDQRQHARATQEAFYIRATVDSSDDGVGIAECNEYDDDLAEIVACNQLSESAREQLVVSHAQAVAAWRERLATGSDDERAAVQVECQAAVDALIQMRISAGC